MADLSPGQGESVAVFGCDDFGVGAVAEAQARGCEPIFVADEDSERLLEACRAGATHVIVLGEDDPVDAIHSVRSKGVRFLVDTTGAAPVHDCLAPWGRVARCRPSAAA